MGKEYKLRFRFPNAQSVNEALRRLPMACGVDDATIGVDFRSPENTGSMPDASAHVQEDGLYFCDYGGMGRHYFGLIVARLVDEFGVVTVTGLG